MIETSCPHCYKRFAQIPFNPDEAMDEIRLSHALKQGLAKTDTWTWKVKGYNCGDKDSQAAKSHWKRARKLGYPNCVERYKFDYWYRETVVSFGWDLEKMLFFEFHGNPKNRKDLDRPMSYQARVDAGFGGYRPVADYEGVDQGGHDTNYRGKKPKGRGKSSKASHGDRSYQPYPATRTQNSDWLFGGTQAENAGGSWEQTNWGARTAAEDPKDDWWTGGTKWWHGKK